MYTNDALNNIGNPILGEFGNKSLGSEIEYTSFTYYKWLGKLNNNFKITFYGIW